MEKNSKKRSEKLFGRKYTRQRKLSVALCTALAVIFVSLFFLVGPGARLVHYLTHPDAEPSDSLEDCRINPDNAIGKLITQVYRWDIESAYDESVIFDDSTTKSVSYTTEEKNYGSITYQGVTYTMANEIVEEGDMSFTLELEEKVADFTGAGSDLREAEEGDAFKLSLYRIKNTDEKFALIGYLAGSDTPYLYDNEDFGVWGDGVTLADYLEAAGIRDVELRLTTKWRSNMWYPDFKMEYLTENIVPAAVQIAEDDEIMEGACKTGLAITMRTCGGERMQINFWDNGCISIQYMASDYDTGHLYYDLNDPELSYGTELIRYMRENGYELMY
ncbi:MAG: hypothetical protein LUE29_10055 [Lachnospiraceae bacterium]|nr:hypothetical protein [Lachnospiraceae bacterium]